MARQLVPPAPRYSDPVQATYTEAFLDRDVLNNSNVYQALTHKQRLFVESYLISLSAEAAAKRASYHPRRANESYKSIGRKLLAKPYIARAIEECMAKRLERTQITGDMVVTELAKIAFANMSDFTTSDENGDRVYWDPKNRELGAVVKTVKTRGVKEGRGESAVDVELTEFQLYDKMAALKLLGDHFGIFKPQEHNHTVRGHNGGAVEHEHSHKITGIEFTGIKSGTFFEPEVIEGEFTEI